MEDRIHVGTMLLQDGTQMPPAVVVKTDPCLADWSQIIGSTSAQLDREIEKTGWTFFYIAGEIRTSSFAFKGQSGMARALGRLIDAVKLQNCNCLEVTQIRQRSFFGLPYTSLVAHARHIQKSRSFYDLQNLPARAAFRSREWLCDGPASVQGKSSASDGEGVQESLTSGKEWHSALSAPAEPLDRIQTAEATSEQKFHAGDEVIVAEGPHKDVAGTFLELEDEMEWAAIQEENGTVSSHPVSRMHRGPLSYRSFTGREKT